MDRKSEFASIAAVMINVGVCMSYMTQINGLSIWVIWDDNTGKVYHYDKWASFLRCANRLAHKYC